ncbi:MAG: hypothetical protein ACT4O2_07645 [Beijerinckiaceae bacterium]
MKNYLRQQSARELLHSTFEIYRRHVGLLMLIYLLPTFPFNVWSEYLEQTTGKLFNTGYYLALVAAMVPAMATAVAVSDICLGNRPSVFRSYARVFGKSFRGIVLTYLMLMAGLFVSFVLFVIPSFFFYAWYMFALIVVVLEGAWGTKAFARSKALGKGYYRRNLGFVLLLFLILFVLVVVIMTLFEVLVNVWAAFSEPLLRSIFTAASYTLISPPLYVGGTLLYYDMRVRKEAYDNTALTEDLMR